MKLYPYLQEILFRATGENERAQHTIRCQFASHTIPCHTQTINLTLRQFQNGTVLPYITSALYRWQCIAEIYAHIYIYIYLFLTALQLMMIAIQLKMVLKCFVCLLFSLFFLLNERFVRCAIVSPRILYWTCNHTSLAFIRRMIE